MEGPDKEKLERVVNSLSFEQKNRLLELPEEDRAKLFDALKQEQEERGKMFGDKKLIMEDLQKNHITIEEPADKNGYPGKIFHVDLPEVKRFKGFKFDYFISDDVFKEAPSKDLPDDEFFTKDELWSILKAVNKYMKANGVLSPVEDNEDNSYGGFVRDLLGRFDGEKKIDGDIGFYTVVYPMKGGDSFQMSDNDFTDVHSFKHKSFKYRLLLRP